MKTTSYQVERQPDGQTGWEQLKPQVDREEDARILLRARRIENAAAGGRVNFRLVKTVRTVVRA